MIFKIHLVQHQEGTKIPQTSSSCLILKEKRVRFYYPRMKCPEISGLKHARAVAREISKNKTVKNMSTYEPY